MLDWNQNQENLISIKGFQDDFSGRSLFRSTINALLRVGIYTRVDCERPNYYPGLSKHAISSASPNISNLEVEDDWFSIKFEYETDDHIDSFVELVSSIWFSYEQPSAVFFVERTVKEKLTDFNWRTKWEEITSNFTSFIIFKSAEDDVMWIGKSSSLQFADVIVD